METFLKSKRRVVLDTTIIVAWFCGTHPYHEKALELRRHFLAKKIEILIPDLALYELAIALRRCCSFDESKMDLVIHSLQVMGIQVVSTSTLCLIRAVEIATNLFVSYPAAYFLALAEQQECQYWTADKEFYNKMSDWRIIRFVKWR